MMLVLLALHWLQTVTDGERLVCVNVENARWAQRVLWTFPCGCVSQFLTFIIIAVSLSPH